VKQCPQPLFDVGEIIVAHNRTLKLRHYFIGDAFFHSVDEIGYYTFEPLGPLIIKIMGVGDRTQFVWQIIV
jgi:hypothetical protein